MVKPNDWGRSETMGEQDTLISNAFQTFLTEAPEQAQAWGALVQSLAQASALDGKAGALAYLFLIGSYLVHSFSGLLDQLSWVRELMFFNYLIVAIIYMNSTSNNMLSEVGYSVTIARYKSFFVTIGFSISLIITL